MSYYIEITPVSVSLSSNPGDSHLVSDVTWDRKTPAVLFLMRKDHKKPMPLRYSRDSDMKSGAVSLP